MDDESSVLQFRDHLKDCYGGFGILVNNAGILIPFHGGPIEQFAEEAAATMKTNYFSLHQSCNILFPLLRPHARVVNISSDFGHLSEIYGTESVAVELRTKLSSDKLTGKELDLLMQNFVE